MWYIKTLIRLHFDYCDVVYDCITVENSNKLQKIQNTCIKSILKVPKRTHTSEILEQSKLQMLSNGRHFHTAVEMFKVTKLLQPESIQKSLSLMSKFITSIREGQCLIDGIPLALDYT